MVQIPIAVAVLLALVIFILGMATMPLIRDAAWREKAKSDTRMFSKGRFYWVMEDGDLTKLNHITGCHREEVIKLSESQKQEQRL